MTLEETIDRLLVDILPLELKDAIDAVLAKGGTPLSVLQSVRRVAHKRDTYCELSIRAYLQCDAEGNYEMRRPRPEQERGA